KILVAYDGSENAEAALEDLKREGWGPEAEILVMTVADVFLPPPINEELDDTFPMYVPEGVKLALARGTQKLAEADSLARQGRDRIKAAFPAWTVRHEAQADSPAWALIRSADEWKPDLILMGARGQSFFGGRLILGSISQRVLYEASCSVRIARSNVKDAHDRVRLLVGVDQSADSTAAVDAICTRSWPSGSEVGVLAVIDTVMALNPEETDPAAMKWI